MAGVAGLLFGGVSAFAAVPVSATTVHYCTGQFGNDAGCAGGVAGVSYNAVAANADAVCVSLVNPSQAAPAREGLFQVPQSCISAGGSSVSQSYSCVGAYAWVGNRHTYTITTTSATHYDYCT